MTSTPIERPGVTYRTTLGQLLGLTDESPAAIEWAKRMDEIALAERSAYIYDLKQRESFDFGTVADAYDAGFAAGHKAGRATTDVLPCDGRLVEYDEGAVFEHPVGSRCSEHTTTDAGSETP